MPWRCFMTEPSEFCRRSLRRYASGTSSHYHDVEDVIEGQFLEPNGMGSGMGREGYEGHPGWPKACACGYAFREEDNWQVNETRLYRGAPDGKLYPHARAPAGAIWRATWMEDISPNPYAGPDGKVWALMMPSGYEWLIYGPSSNGGKWSVTGELPAITVSPSIAQQGGSAYHGFVKNGVITDDCDGRKFDKFPSTA